MVSVGEWKKSVKIKCMAMFILQLALIYVVAKWLGVSGISVELFISGFFGILFGSINAFDHRKVCIAATVYICAMHILMNFDGFFTDARREYHELKSFSGVIFRPCKGRGKSVGLGAGELALKSPEGGYINYCNKDERYSGFYCDRFLGGSCSEEIGKYFGKPSSYLREEVISVKYAAFIHHADIFPFITDERGLVYEMSYDGNIIYPYEYFIEKYSTGKKKFYIFTIFLLGATIGFGVAYKRIK